MEADIKYLMTKKIREVLDLCGIHEYSHEAVQQHASTMARFGTLRHVREDDANPCCSPGRSTPSWIGGINMPFGHI